MWQWTTFNILTVFSLSPHLRSRWSTCHWGLWGWTVSWSSLTPHCRVPAAHTRDRLAPHSSIAHWEKPQNYVNVQFCCIKHDKSTIWFFLYIVFVKNLFKKIFSTFDQGTRFPSHIYSKLLIYILKHLNTIENFSSSFIHVIPKNFFSNTLPL